jgi:archaellum component FlaG (FlaF/FlaG flagellin family)
MTTQFMRNYIDLINEAQQPQQLDEGAAETIAALVKKIPGIGRYIELAQQYKPQLVQILKTSKSGEEVKKKMEDLVSQAPVPVSESGLMKQLGGAAALAGSVLSVAMMNYVGMIDGVLQKAADGEMGGAIAAGTYLGLIPVGLMIIGVQLLFKGAKQSNDEKTKKDLSRQNQKGLGEADSGPADIGQIAASLKFLPTTKLARKYQFVANGVPGRMPAMTYTVAAQEQPVVTVTSDGKETQNVAAVNDIIMSGPSQENYVVKAAKFPKLYQGAVGKTVIPEQSPRMVALYRGPQAVTFTAPWGESMVLKPGDYLVKDGDAGYYRIARVEYDQTYNAPGKQGMTEQELDELTRRDFLRGAGAALGGAALASLADKVGARVPLKGGEVDPDYRPRPIQVKVDKF